MLSGEIWRRLLPLALGKAKAYLQAIELVFPVDILDKCLEVEHGFFGHFGFLFVLFSRHGVDYSICSGARPNIFPYPPAQ